jgi:hypothetical protein
MVWFYVITIGGLLLLSGLLWALYEGMGFPDALNTFLTIKTNVMNDYHQNALYPDQARRWDGIRQNMWMNHIKLGVLSLVLSISAAKLVKWLAWDVISSTVDSSSQSYVIVRWGLLGIVGIIMLVAVSRIVYRERMDAFQLFKSNVDHYGLNAEINQHAKNILQIYSGIGQILYVAVVFWQSFL